MTQMTFKNVVLLNRDEFSHCEAGELQAASTCCTKILPLKRVKGTNSVVFQITS